MNALERIMREELTARGPMRFDRFMELALYHPEHGYYANPRPVGRQGDFFTSVSVGPLFGTMLAWQARQMAELLGETEFWLMEQGAHDGRLARDILEEAARHPKFFARLHYLIIGSPPSYRAVQEKTLAGFADKVKWLDDGTAWEGPKPAGLFLSNELVDAFPVRLVERAADDWRERVVMAGNSGSLAWSRLAIEDAALRFAVDQLCAGASEGSRREIGLQARKWMGDVGRLLRRGYIVTIDYGYTASELDARTQGTLTAYRDHQRSDDVLASPGEQDITAHVDFTALAQSGDAAGWPALALVDQQRFLTGILALGGQETLVAKDVRLFQALTHPEHLGARFRVLVQAKDAPTDSLAGLRFARGGQLG